jgi:hypothetical protein
VLWLQLRPNDAVPCGSGFATLNATEELLVLKNLKLHLMGQFGRVFWPPRFY